MDAATEVRQHSGELKKELRLADLVAIQILTIIGFSWIGVAGKIGPANWMFWVPAIFLFYVPSGIVVAHLAKEMPFEGGMYQWVRLRIGPLAGFLVAMDIWLFFVLMTAGIGLQIMGTAPFWMPADALWLASDKRSLIGVGVVCSVVLMWVSWRGLGVGKWINNFGGYGQILLYLAVILVAAPHWMRGGVSAGEAALTAPALTLLNLNLLGKMGFGALCGVDAVAVFAGECRSKDVGQVIRSSVWIAAPVIGIMMVLGTASVLTFVRPEAIDLVVPPVQVLSAASPVLGKIGSLWIVLLLLAGGCLSFSVMTRLPMVAGWDHLLPDWFGRLDPQYQTPVGSVLFSGAVSIVFAVVANAGAGMLEAFQFVFTAALISYACAYMAMFAIPLVGQGEKPGWGVRIASVSGFATTLMFVALSIFPIVEEQNPGLFTAKMVGLVAGLHLAGILFYRRRVRE